MMTVNNKTFFYRFTVHGNSYNKFHCGVLTMQQKTIFDPIKEIKEIARKKYPDCKTIDITALNPL